MTLLNRSRNDPSFEKMFIGLFFPFFEAAAEPDDAGVETGEGETEACKLDVANCGRTGVFAGVGLREGEGVAAVDICKCG